MSKTFSIVKTIDVDKLHSEIGRYLSSNENKPYIFMNFDTIETIAHETILKIVPSTRAKYNGYVALVEGNKVFVDNDLSFGEVEIR